LFSDFAIPARIKPHIPIAQRQLVLLRTDSLTVPLIHVFHISGIVGIYDADKRHFKGVISAMMTSTSKINIVKPSYFEVSMSHDDIDGPDLPDISQHRQQNSSHLCSSHQ
jgi:hypothetical protein